MEGLIHTILAASYIGIFLVVFAETGLLIGAVLPGDSLLITAGIVAANQSSSVKLNIIGVIISVLAGGVLGSLCGYYLGHRWGDAIFSKQSSLVFKPEYKAQAEAFFAKEGAKSVLLARFLPFIRAVVPTLAGITKMDFKEYMLYSSLGAILWGVGLPLAGYYVGKLIPDLDKYILFIVIGVVLLSAIPVLSKVLKTRSKT